MTGNDKAIRQLRAENDELREQLSKAHRDNALLRLGSAQDAETAQAQVLSLRKEVGTADGFLGVLSDILGVTEKTLPAIERAARRAAEALRAQQRRQR